jgi:hypothetical protein
MARPLIHIGYQKSASSWLQRHLFTGEAGLAHACSENKIKELIIKPHDLAFEPGACRAQLLPLLGRIEKRGLVPVLSAERLSGDLNLASHDSARLAGRLASVLPEGRVMIVIREQRAMILAAYKQYVSAGGLLRLRDYVAGGPHSSYQWPFEFAQFEYDRLIRRYRELFGEENVLALPFELFRRDGRDFVARILRFAGADASAATLERIPVETVSNAARRPMGVPVKRGLNRVLRQRLTPWGRVDPGGRVGVVMRRFARAAGHRSPSWLNETLENRWRATVAHATGDYYRASNARTSELIGIDLREYAYDMPPAQGGDQRAGDAARERVRTRA